LVNSNPATIMTDPDFADRTYIEPVTWEACERIIAKERPTRFCPRWAARPGSTSRWSWPARRAQKYGVRLIGANEEPSKRPRTGNCSSGHDQDRFGCPQVPHRHPYQAGPRGRQNHRLPLILRPAFTLGGSGGGVAYNLTEFKTKIAYALELSPTSQCLVEESITGWKEFELEVMRDKADNVVIVCSIENFDAMGVHTGDSITVAPAQTLTDKEYQYMRDAALAIIREIGVDTGGSNIQFGVNPKNGRLVIIEMNPRVSRSSALASKATGFPIAKIAAKLAVGYTLDELKNDITNPPRRPLSPRSTMWW